MYLLFASLLQKPLPAAELFRRALMAPQEIPDLLEGTPENAPLLRRLEMLGKAGSIFIDLFNADPLLSQEDRESVVLAIRNTSSRHGFCIARAGDPRAWAKAAFTHRHPLLHWRGLTSASGWECLGYALRGDELTVFRHLLQRGRTTPEQVARDGAVFSQLPKPYDWRVQEAVASGRPIPSPSAYNLAEGQRLLARLKALRLVFERQGTYCVVRPERWW